MMTFYSGNTGKKTKSEYDNCHDLVNKVLSVVGKFEDKSNYYKNIVLMLLDALRESTEPNIQRKYKLILTQLKDSYWAIPELEGWVE